jgi:putative ABC transport system ATP-binding protein
MELLKSENIVKTYEDNGVPVQAVNGISLSVNEGEHLVLAGPSGSGKTTLLNLLGALDKPTSGKIFFEGEEFSSKSKKQLSEFRLNKLGFIFQAYNLIPVLSAIENIEFSMMLLGIPENERRNKSIALLEDLGIGELKDKRPNEMSGGQQQRVAVARAIVNRPKLVLADEPTANLDSKTGAHLLDLMDKMNEEKKITFIFASHDQQVIERARRLVKIKDGKIVNE